MQPNSPYVQRRRRRRFLAARGFPAVASGLNHCHNFDGRFLDELSNVIFPAPTWSSTPCRAYDQLVWWASFGRSTVWLAARRPLPRSCPATFALVDLPERQVGGRELQQQFPFLVPRACERFSSYTRITSFQLPRFRCKSASNS